MGTSKKGRLMKESINKTSRRLKYDCALFQSQNFHVINLAELSRPNVGRIRG